MPTLNLVAGDYDYTEQGTHICNELGYATKVESPKSVNVTQEVYDIVQPALEFDRINNRGLNADGSQP